MNFLKQNNWLVSLFCAFIVGIIVFFISYRSSKVSTMEETLHTIQVVTNVKWQLIESKLSSLEQQLGILSKNETLKSLVATTNSAPKINTQFDAYIKSLLYSQGCSNMLLITKSGEITYTSNPSLDKTTVPSEIFQFAEQGLENSNFNSKILLNKGAPHQFYLSKQIINTNGDLYGAIFIEIPKEFLSIELHNTISLDSLDSYLVSSQGTIDQLGKLNADTCISCRWSNDSFIVVSPDKKIKETWALLSAYPISQIQAEHIRYVSALDGMMAFFMTCIFVMVVMYSIQLVQKSKGITNADILLVQTTWNAVSEFSTKIIAGFYKHLFNMAPEVRPMFKSDQATQEKRMALMINTIVNSADSLEEFKGSISQLAKKHIHMGVKNEYFPIVVKAIISSVEDQYGKGFTSAHRKAWYKILNRISAIMMEEMESYQRTLRGASS